MIHEASQESYIRILFGRSERTGRGGGRRLPFLGGGGGLLGARPVLCALLV